MTSIDCSAASPGKTINGLGGDDTITGTAFADTIDGADGNDTITSGPVVSLGNDSVIGGAGNDTITGLTELKPLVDEYAQLQAAAAALEGVAAPSPGPNQAARGRTAVREPARRNSSQARSAEGQRHPRRRSA